MSKYHTLKSHLTIGIEEVENVIKSSVTKMIESAYKNNEEIPEFILKNINFLEGVFQEYYLRTENYQHNIKNKETLAQNIMGTLPLEVYKKYMDITWLKTFEDDDKKLINSLIGRENFPLINNFLDLVSQENKSDDFNREVFEPIFHLDHHIRNLLSNNFKNRENPAESVKKYFKTFYKALEVYEPFYKETCKIYKTKAKDVKKWHKNFEHLYVLNRENKLHDINLYLIKNDDFLEIVKEIFSQYDNPQENTILSKEHFDEVIKSGSEKMVTFYISELLKNNIMTQEEIELQIVKSFHGKINEIESEISDSFRENYKNDYQNTYNIKSVYDIAIKYGNYKPNYKYLSVLLLIDNQELQNNFVSKILPENKVILSGLKVDQWKQLSAITEQIKEITGKGFQESAKQRDKKNDKELLPFIIENPYEVIYKMNRINKLFLGQTNPISEKQMNEVYAYYKNEVSNKMITPIFDIEKFRLNNKLNAKFEEKGKVKPNKI